MTFVEDVLDLYSLDQNAYFSTPSLAYQLMLKFAAPHQIHLIEDLEIHLKIEKAIYGGLVFHNDRYIQCNPTHPDNPSHGLCLDHNGLYANCMSNYKMPIGDYNILESQD